jgi:hypothetical protein
MIFKFESKITNSKEIAFLFPKNLQVFAEKLQTVTVTEIAICD